MGTEVTADGNLSDFTFNFLQKLNCISDWYGQKLLCFMPAFMNRLQSVLTILRACSHLCSFAALKRTCSVRQKHM